MNIQLPFTRAQRLQFAGICLAVLIVVLIARIFKTRRTVNNETSNPDRNVKAFLAVIRHCEGTDGPNGYRTMFTGKTFMGYASHPNQTNRANGLSSTAAGAYQILYSTWLEVKAVLGLADFSPANQDKAAIYLIDKKRKALDDIKAGRLSEAVQKCAKEWASLPVITTITDSRRTHPAGRSYYGGQPSKSFATIRAKFAEFGGIATS